jgi:hypothetical protein
MATQHPTTATRDQVKVLVKPGLLLSRPAITRRKQERT